MNRWLCASVLLSVTACNPSLDLEGPKSDGGSTDPATDGDSPSADGGADAGDEGGKVGPSKESGASDAGSGRPVSTCLAKSVTGSSRILMDGTQGYIENVNDIALGPSDVYAFSDPFGLYATSLSGGAVQELSPTETLPSLIAGAIAPSGSVVGGSFSSESVLVENLPSGLGTFLGLRGPSFYELTVTSGQIAVDGTDVFYWTPTQLVQASLAGAPDRLVASYPSSSPTVTAMAFDSTYLYFATSDGVLHRTPRSGGPIDDVATLLGPIDGILVAGGTLYLSAQRVAGLGRADFEMSSFDLASMTTMESMTLPLITARTTPIVFDGSAFYWGASAGEADCGGALMRLTTSAFAAQGPEETLVTNLDVPLVVRTLTGNVYIGTSGDATYRKPLTQGQLLFWTP